LTFAAEHYWNIDEHFNRKKDRRKKRRGGKIKGMSGHRGALFAACSGRRERNAGDRKDLRRVQWCNGFVPNKWLSSPSQKENCLHTA
jgi:hypothetical protein